MNVGKTDRLLRGIIGLLLLASPLLNIPAIWSSATLFYASLVVGAVLLATAIFKVCPMYKLFGLSTDHN